MLATIETTSAASQPAAVPERILGYTIVDSPSPLPLGRLLVGATTRGVCAVRLGRSDAALEAELAREYPDAELRRDGAPLAPWVNALLRHLTGHAARLDLPLDVEATAFQQRVWQALRAIPYGETRSYGAVAEAIGQPGAARAVARACAANPVALVIPCHRVVRGDGDPGGYRWGVARKRLLLEQERSAAQRAERRVLRDLIDAIGGGTSGPVPAEGPLAAGEVLAGALRDRPRARRGRHGCRVRGPRPGARRDRRAQAAARALQERGCRGTRPLPPRGPDHTAHLARARRPHPRHRRGGRTAFHHHGVRGRLG